MSPEEAGMHTLKRIAHNYNNDMSKLIYVSMHFYILRKDGAYAGVTMWSGSPEHPARFAVADGNVWTMLKRPGCCDCGQSKELAANA